MVIRIRFGRGATVTKTRVKNRRLALACAALLMPGALMAGVLGFWRVAADLNWTGEFAITRGPFSHWQVWIACATALLWLARLLNRYGKRPEGESEPARPPQAFSRAASGQ